MSNDQNQQLLSELLAAQEKGEAVVLATIVKARGSVPRRSGAKMLIYSDGRVSAGPSAAGRWKRASFAKREQCLANGDPRVVPYSLVDPERGDPGVCGGEVEVYLEPYAPPADAPGHRLRPCRQSGCRAGPLAGLSRAGQ